MPERYRRKHSHQHVQAVEKMRAHVRYWGGICCKIILAPKVGNTFPNQVLIREF
jgi:hypothetical protein